MVLQSPKITFFGCEIVFSSIPSPPGIVSLIQALPISFSRFKYFQFHVVDYPPPLEIVSLTQEQAFLILHSRLLSNCVISRKM